MTSIFFLVQRVDRVIYKSDITNHVLSYYLDGKNSITIY